MANRIRGQIPALPKTLDEAVDALLRRLLPEVKSLIRRLEQDDLAARLHFTLGQAIRNDFGL